MAFNMNVDLNQKLVEFLTSAEIVDNETIERGLNESEAEGVSLVEWLVSKDLVSAESLGGIVGDILGIPYVNLGREEIDTNIMKQIPETMARAQKIVVFGEDENNIKVAMAEPGNEVTVDLLGKKFGKNVEKYYATETDIEAAMQYYASNLAEDLDNILEAHIQSAKGNSAEDAPIIDLVDTIISYAAHSRASDIHIEPEREAALVRFRVDGILRDVVSLPRDIFEQVVVRIKVLAKLRTDEHMAPQDGKISYQQEDEHYDIRVSLVPITVGEKVVMRILSDIAKKLSLHDLGFLGEDLEKLKLAYDKPHGMILSTGPTGSGKTTTMYAILKLLNKEDVNIMTIEDPVEYELPRVNQIQVNSKTNLTFAAGLRSIVRQDPDIILVGEIRDQETADIAVNSAMTGHLVLSTLHTNDAATALPRLLEMGVEPFLVSSTVNLIIGQRLVRKICTACRITEEHTKADWKWENQVSVGLMEKVFGDKQVWTMYKGKGCPVCHGSGYAGRLGIYEVLVVDEQIRQTLMKKANAEELEQVAIQNGMRLMIEDGLEKVKQGMTTIEELLRVTME